MLKKKKTKAKAKPKKILADHRLPVCIMKLSKTPSAVARRLMRANETRTQKRIRLLKRYIAVGRFNLMNYRIQTRTRLTPFVQEKLTRIKLFESELKKLTGEK